MARATPRAPGFPVTHGASMHPYPASLNCHSSLDLSVSCRASIATCSLCRNHSTSARLEASPHTFHEAKVDKGLFGPRRNPPLVVLTLSHQHRCMRTCHPARCSTRLRALITRFTASDLTKRSYRFVLPCDVRANLMTEASKLTPTAKTTHSRTCAGRRWPTPHMQIHPSAEGRPHVWSPAFVCEFGDKTRSPVGGEAPVPATKTLLKPVSRPGPRS